MQQDTCIDGAESENKKKHEAESENKKKHEAESENKQKHEADSENKKKHEVDSENKKKHEADSSNKKKHETKNSPQNQLLDPVRSSSSSKFVGAQATSSAADPVVSRSGSHSNPKKSGTRNEVGFIFLQQSIYIYQSIYKNPTL